MTDRSPVYLDTNVIIHAFEKRDALSSALVALLTSTTAGRRVCVTSQLTYAEAIQRPYADRNEDRLALYTGWLERGTTSLEVGPISADVLYYAAVLRADHKALKLPDAIHIATAFGFGCRYLMSADERLPAKVRLSNTRWGMSRGGLEIEVIRPTLATVSSLIGLES